MVGPRVVFAYKFMRVFFLMIDGLGDVGVEELGWKSPLQAAATPNLDKLARMGWTRLMDPVEAGVACGSDTAHLPILGYDPRVYYQGRGAFETIGAGLLMKPGDIAFKCNLAVWDPSSGLVASRRVDKEFTVEGSGSL
jgi:2,3-diphosphopglycerate-independent phosphoglycerate mutase